MNKNKIIGSILIILLLITFVFRGKLFRSKELKQNPDLISELDKLHDSKLSKDPSVVSMALVRLTNKQVPEGKSEAIKLINSENPLIRAGAGRALLLFSIRDPEVSKAIETLLEDKEQSVRVAILESMLNRFDEERSALISKFLTRPNLSIDEQLLAHYALYAISRVEAERSKHFDFIFKQAENESGSGQTRAMGLLIRMSGNPKAKELLKKELRFAASIQDPKKLPLVRARIWPSIYRFLSQTDAEFVRSNFKTFAHHPDLSLQISALSTIRPLCPKDRWNVLKEMRFNPQTHTGTIQAWLTAVDQLGGKNAAPMIQAHFNLKETVQNQQTKRVADLFKKYSTVNTADSCEKKN